MVALSVLVLLALVLAAAGLHAVVSYSVSRRQREIGFRRAPRADRSDVLMLLLGQGMRLVGMGLALGLLVALVAILHPANQASAVDPVGP